MEVPDFKTCGPGAPMPTCDGCSHWKARNGGECWLCDTYQHPVRGTAHACDFYYPNDEDD